MINLFKIFNRESIPDKRDPCKIPIDLSSSYESPSLVARKIWQELFNFYRERSGDLSNMDNLLCDYPIIIKRIEEAQRAAWSYRETYFWWAFAGWWTTIQDYPLEGGLKVAYFPGEHLVEIEEVL